MTFSEAGSGARDEISVVAALILRAGCCLVSRRADDDPLGPVWEFPGGKVEPGESLAGALRRELSEELGISVRVGEQIDRIYHSYPQHRVRLHFLRCFILDGEPRGSEGQEIAWVSPEQMLDMPFPEADRRFLARLPALLRAWLGEEL